MSQLFVSQDDVDAVARLLSRVSWDEDPTDVETGIDDTDDDNEEDV